MPDIEPIISRANRGMSWRVVAVCGTASLALHVLFATTVYVEGRYYPWPGGGDGDGPITNVELVSPDALGPSPVPPEAPETPKPEAKIEPPQPPDPPKPPEPPPQTPKPLTPPKPLPFKPDPSQVVPATRDQATPPQGTQAAPTTAKRTSDTPDKPDTQNADQAPPAPQPDQVAPQPDSPQQADAKPPDDPIPADPNGILPKQEPPKVEQPKPQKQAAVVAPKPPSKIDGGTIHQTMAPLVVTPDALSGRAGNSAAVSYPSAARANGLQGRVTLQALVTRGGEIRRINIVKSSGYDELDESAVRAVWLWHFTVTAPDQRFTEAWIEIPIDFRLH